MGDVLTRAWRRLRALPPFWVVFAAWAFVVVYAFPGFMNWDASEQETQARFGGLGDGHPPIMAVLWRGAEQLVHGPFLMLLVQTSLFAWGLFAAFRLRFSARTAAWLAAALLLFPPIFTPMSVVWKDAQMAGFLLAGTMLALRGSHGRSWRQRGLGLALLFLGVGVRHNAPFALLALVVFVVAAWGVRRKLAVVGAGIGVALAITGAALLVNGHLGRPEHTWVRTIAMHDVMGTICMAEPLTDDQVRALLVGVPLQIDTDIQHKFCARYDPRVWFSVSFDAGAPFAQLPDATEQAARVASWNRVVFGDPLAYLHHRLRVFREVIGLTASSPWEPVCQDFGANKGQMQRLHEEHSLSKLQRAVGRIGLALAKTPAYRPWIYLVIAVMLFGYAAWRRDGWIAALCASGILYEGSYFIGAPSPDFRYSHWLVTCCCIALITVIGERYRSARASRSADPGCAARV